MYIMVINCGSSSLKFQLISFPEETVIAKGLIERIGQEDGAQFTLAAGNENFANRAVDAPDHTKAVTAALEALTSGNCAILKSKDEIKGVGHRVVHGGEEFTAPVIITLPSISIPFFTLKFSSATSSLSLLAKLAHGQCYFNIFIKKIGDKSPINLISLNYI